MIKLQEINPFIYFLIPKKQIKAMWKYLEKLWRHDITRQGFIYFDCGNISLNILLSNH